MTVETLESAGPKRLKGLHIIPESAVKDPMRFHGSTKDIRCRTEYFQDRGFQITELVVVRQEKNIIRKMKDLDLGEFDFVMLDIPKSYPAALKFIRRRHEKILLIFRSHNAEFLHRLDWMRAASSVGEKWEYAKRALIGLWKDFRSAQRADLVFTIAAADAGYWEFLTKIAGRPRKTKIVPYFVPSAYAPEEGKTEKKDECVCFTAITPNPLIADAARNFMELVKRLQDRLPEWRFSITGDHGWVGLPARVEPLGLLESPLPVLRRARAVAVLSDFGRGFKTKILEAVQAKAYVLVTPNLFKRLPAEVHPFCVPVRHDSVEDFADALCRCRSPYPDLDCNALLRGRAYSKLDAIFGCLTPRQTNVTVPPELGRDSISN